MIEIPPDPFDEFFSLPVAKVSSDPSFDVRRVHPGEFEPIYDCVDAAFSRTRPRAMYDWLYLRNPYGKAQVWAVAEKATGRVLKTGASFPWPVWRGRDVLRGALSGDAATVPDWQRKGLSTVRRDVRRSHPWHGTVCSLSGPNANSRIVTAKRGDVNKILGRLAGGVLPLAPAPASDRAGRFSTLVSASNRAASRLLTAWQGLALRRVDGVDRRVEELSRFTSEFDALTLRTMDFPGYWCPHGWQFLNWRYLDHPVEPYSAFVLREGDSAVGYGVLRIDAERATVAEFAVDVQPRGRAIDLFVGLLDVARQAGCRYISFFGTPAWRHWGLFRRAGMLPVPTNNFFEASYDIDPVGSQQLRNWQVMPGDRDFH